MLQTLLFPFKSEKSHQISLNMLVGFSVQILTEIIKDNTPVLNCAHITLTTYDHIARNADIHFKMWRHCWLEKLNSNNHASVAKGTDTALSLVPIINLTL
jgi:hypothetical protein